MFKAAEDFNPLRTIDVEWGCCMAAGFNLQPRLAGGSIEIVLLVPQLFLGSFEKGEIKKTSFSG
ncbi:hypothetical protein SapgrDRAFT_2895 [Saprospira grandis DSM 2844]|uniref:Uncharacterized protein n=1 Tax=Saprospira grandis DSM 2844 TaxID=694433 RepID=J0P3X1_9BACT|nr:hypothetical protein [Saprospira grandis]EJF54549.1 hypothetical protein SapgrDRAFT_2895 [Saprospira grandis DSM 2844]